MKQKYNTYFLWGTTVLSVIILGVLFFFFLLRIEELMTFLGKILSILAPIISGAAIAYLINPVVDFCERHINTLFSFCRIPTKLRHGLSKAISITLSLGLLIYGIALLFSMVLPELYSSIMKLVGDFQKYITIISTFINEHLQNNPQLLNYAKTALDTATKMLDNWINNELLIKMQNIMSGLTVGILGIAKLATNIVVALIVSVYLLVSKERFRGQLKKLLYVIFKPEKANAALSIFRQVNKIFGGFISGKLIDSLIIGILCFIGVTVLAMPYPLLISVIVGVTNVLPFFGPYIGAIPSAFLILLIDPPKCLVFVIFILILQQLDGNVIGPAILGDSTGLSPFWVVTSILVGGGLFGFFGMLLGVPTFAVIYFLIKTFSEYHLKKRHLPTASLAYCRVDKIDPETGAISFLKKTPQSRRQTVDTGLMDALDKISFLKKKSNDENSGTNNHNN